jgi:hypothetical protein
MARWPRQPRLSPQTLRHARSAPTAGQPHGRRGAGSCPRAQGCGACSTRSCRGRRTVQARGAIGDSTGPGTSPRQRPHGSLRNACGAWPRGHRRTAVGPWPRGCCRGVAVGVTAPRPLLVRSPTAPPMPSIGGATPQTGCSTPGVMGTAPPTARIERYAPWHCRGTCTRMARACGVTSRRGWLPCTTSTAGSIPQTGCITSGSLPLWVA